MIKSLSERPIRPIEIDLTGPNGNAFNLLALASQLCQTHKKDFARLREEMISGDYENLLTVLDREFGEYLIFYR